MDRKGGKKPWRVRDVDRARASSGNSLRQVIPSGDLVSVAQGRGVVAVLAEILAEARILTSDGVLHQCKYQVPHAAGEGQYVPG